MALSVSQTNFFSVQNALWLVKALIEPNTYRRNLRHRSHEPTLLGANAQAQGLRVGLLILVLEGTEDHQLIANKGPP
jgi:hypothetical protein